MLTQFDICVVLRVLIQTLLNTKLNKTRQWHATYLFPVCLLTSYISVSRMPIAAQKYNIRKHGFTNLSNLISISQYDEVNVPQDCPSSASSSAAGLFLHSSLTGLCIPTCECIRASAVVVIWLQTEPQAGYCRPRHFQSW